MKPFLFMTLVVGAFLLVAVFLTGEDADSSPETASSSDDLAQEVAFERIALLAAACYNCHGSQGRLVTAIPPIAGRPRAVLEAQLLAFREDAMPGATVMPRLAKGYTVEELQALAYHFSLLSPAVE